tara:strand:- start:112 stop:432 length:321 start_codon:yes stop_codon:yes gene_type:complete
MNDQLILLRRSARRDRIEWRRIFPPIDIPLHATEQDIDTIMHAWTHLDVAGQIPTSWLQGESVPPSPATTHEGLPVNPLGAANRFGYGCSAHFSAHMTGGAPWMSL